MNTDSDYPGLLTLQEAATMLKVHMETLRRWDRIGKLSAIKMGTRGDRRYRLSDIQAIMEEDSSSSVLQTPEVTVDDFYISPNLKLFDTFKDADAERIKYGDLYLPETAVDPLAPSFIFTKTFVIAEPGLGKSRLLYEICKTANVLGEGSILVDLKKFADSRLTSLEEYIKTLNPSLATKKFQAMSSSEAVFCLDSLDEIRADEFSGTVDKIKTFAKTYPQLSILITSRWHFFKNHESLFNNFDFNYAVIKPFEMESMMAYLNKKGIDGKQVGRLFEILHISGRELVVKIPRYLEILASYVKEKGVENITSLSRADLFDHFIYKKLDLEDKRLNSKNKIAIKRALEMLALTMEIYQANTITEDELHTFFGDAEGLSQFVKDLPLEILYEKSLLKKSDDIIEFDNAEFQEYLAAKQILRIGRPLYTVFDLAVEPELREVQPSWFSTLSFLIDLEPKLLRPMLEFRVRGETSFVQLEQYHVLLTKVNLNQVPVEDRKAIFERIFTYYQTVQNWIDWEIARNLSYYFDNSQSELLKQYVNKKTFTSNTERVVQLANVAQAVGFLIAHNILDEEETKYWRTQLIKFAQEKSDNGVIQRNSLFALEQLGDPSVVQEVEVAWEHPDRLVREHFIELCSNVAPNSEISIKYFAKALKINMFQVYQGIYSISTSVALINFFDLLIADEETLESFLERSDTLVEDRSKKLISVFDKVWNEDVKKTLEQLVLKTFKFRHGYMGERSKLIKEIALFLESKNPEYIFSLLEGIRNSEELKNNIFGFENVTATILQKDQVAQVIEMLNETENGKWLIFRALQDIKFSKRPDADEVFEAGRRYFPEEYKEAEKRWSAEAQKDSQGLKIYQDFLFKLQPEVDKYRSDIFIFFLEKQEIIQKHWKKEDRERFTKLITGSIFSKFDPGEHGVTITQNSDNSRTYTTHSAIIPFGESIRVAAELKMDISEFRPRIVSYIPHAYHNHLKAIFTLIDKLSDKEVDRLLKVYLEKNSDLWRHQPDNFVEAAKRFKIAKAVPILKEFVNEESFTAYERVNALQAIDVISPDVNYLDQVFKKYEKSNNDLANTADELLITNHTSEIAVKRRVQSIKDRAFTFIEVEGAHSVGHQEEELHTKKHAAPLMILKDPKYEPVILDLLDHSFDLIAKDKTYWPYASYIWEVIYKYFENRKAERKYTPIKNLEDHLQLHLGREGVNWFTSKLKDLRRSYMIFIGRPSSFMEAVGTYNLLKKKQYLQIANNQDLLQEIKNVVNGEILDFIKAEGKTLLKSGESNIQKQLITQIENAFLKHGFTGKKQVVILRESQAIDDTRCDFLIYYGFLGPILIELKLSEHQDLGGEKLNEKESYLSFKSYLTNYKAEYGIFLVLENKERSPRGISWLDHLLKIKQSYEQIPNVQVLGLTS